LGKRGEGEVPTFRGPHAYKDTPRCDDAFETSRQGSCASVAEGTLNEEEKHDKCIKSDPLEIVICRHRSQ